MIILLSNIQLLLKLFFFFPSFPRLYSVAHSQWGQGQTQGGAWSVLEPWGHHAPCTTDGRGHRGAWWPHQKPVYWEEAVRRRSPSPVPQWEGLILGWGWEVGVGGTKYLFQRGQVARPYPGQKPTGRAGGHSGRRAVPLSLCPSGEGEEGCGLGQVATLSCPIPSSAGQNGFDVCLKMKPDTRVSSWCWQCSCSRQCRCGAGLCIAGWGPCSCLEVRSWASSPCEAVSLFQVNPLLEVICYWQAQVLALSWEQDF